MLIPGYILQQKMRMVFSKTRFYQRNSGHGTHEQWPWEIIAEMTMAMENLGERILHLEVIHI